MRMLRDPILNLQKASQSQESPSFSNREKVGETWDTRVSTL